MIEQIERELKWLEDAKDRKYASNASERLYNRKTLVIENEIARLETFVMLKPNERIQTYWLPIIDKWHTRLIACQYR